MINKCLYGALALFVLFPAPEAIGQQITRYEYDALGRLIGVKAEGDKSGGVDTNINYDPAGNRTNYSNKSTGPGALCELQASDANAYTDEYDTYAQISHRGPCTSNISLKYTIRKISGTGSWWDAGFTYGTNILKPTDEYIFVTIDPKESSIPFGQELILAVEWSVSSGNAIISPSTSKVRVLSSK